MRNCSNGQDFAPQKSNETATGDFGGHWGLTLPLSARQTRAERERRYAWAAGLTMDKPTLLWNKQATIVLNE
jgi:hypothetical protein